MAAEEAKWLNESNEEHTTRVARREGRISSITRDKESIRKQLDVLGPILTGVEKAGRAVKNLKGNNIGQQVPGILEDLKGVVAVAEEREKVLHLAAEYGWDFVKK